MFDAPNVFVAGLGRCGTTMVMSMLDRGGFPVGDFPPAYERQTPMVPGQISAHALEPFRGSAVKWIDPTVSKAPQTVRARTIWLDRDVTEQARSQLKFMAVPASRRQLRALAARLQSDAGRARRIVAAHGPVLYLTFENILRAPEAAAARVQEFLGPVAWMDARRAASAVMARSPACAADLSIEVAKMMEARHG